jgi:hypothetical protein
MTGFVITLDKGVALVNRVLNEMYGSEVIVPTGESAVEWICVLEKD